MTKGVFVQLLNICKSFNQDDPIIKNLDLDIHQGEFLTLLGPSGCGKTTTLRMIAGFELPTSGEIVIDGENITQKPPYLRCVNTVFQNYALFPHMNIYDNIAFGLKMKKMTKSEIKDNVSKMLKMVQLEGFENRMPSMLSGGQMQRVAIARAIVNKPKVLLLDEPLGALDLKLRKQMQLELKHLQKILGITFVFVTHDQEEALTMSDRIVVMNSGVIEQIGTPEELYEHPRTKFVATFLGETNILEGEIIKLKENEVLLKLYEEEDIIRIPNHNYNLGDKFIISVRPERIKIKETVEEGDVWLICKFKERIYVGSAIKVIMLLKDNKEIIVNEPIGQNFVFLNETNNYFVTWNPNHTIVIKE
ncbi:polyamine ABC transporter ATP-binding protein [Clostridium estertheticum]|uniref:ABC transporter ATP-binding protein n=1 Tax=Clostridium estertheticum TaxID=238834 RepID=UPI001C6E42DC|nr:polyamine ABC transporter ATP-binding protein [Clostridium estertheticum]MBW9171932.1 polyamine ABC transporter ATP-binding protein [Clostridium estertheticum]WLC73774.1 polyamine ABC transporter ATP-binding protein [Clostridium estertheticum]